MDMNLLIACERGTIGRSALDEDELAVASIAVAEYRVGIELADSPERAARHRTRRPPLPRKQAVR
jgi:tRNA(fMet)-specific endonuclease VapC